MTALGFHPYRVSALYRAQLALGARWVEDGEWRLPESFAEPEVEAERVRQGVGLQDVSPIGKLDVKGRGAERFFDRFAARADFSLLRLTPDHVILLTPPERQEQVAGLLLATLSQEPCAHLTDVTSALSVFVLVGPRASEVLARLTPLDLRSRAFPNGACAEAGLAKVHAIISREDWGQLPAYRLLVGREHGEYAWDVIRDAGASLGLVPFGQAAARLLRGGT